jgi:TM2 domain-containing membrane protein YozV
MNSLPALSSFDTRACQSQYQPQQCQKNVSFTTFSEEDPSMAGQGSTGNVIAAVCSFFIPGLGQLVQGRLVIAIIQFALAIFLWFFLLGWVIHLWSILDAALWKPPAVAS